MVVAGLLMTASALQVMPSTQLVMISIVLGWALIVLALADISVYRLPDVITLPLIVIGLGTSWWLPTTRLHDHVIGAVLGYAVLAGIAYVYRRLRKREGLGLGDAKLVAAAGAWLGWQALPSVLLIGCGLAFVWLAVRALIQGRKTLYERLAFGAPLCAAIWWVWLIGPLV